MVYCSNVFDEDSFVKSIDDVFVRKADANCRNFYNFKAAEYVWKLPDSNAAWKSLNKYFVESLSKGDDSLFKDEQIDTESYSLISGLISNLADPDGGSLSGRTYSDQLSESGTNFSLLNTYFYTQGAR